jgi:UDP-N-acetylmuramate dehydrogenase
MENQVLPTFVRTRVSLAPYTTLGVGGEAAYFAEVTNHSELKEAVAWAKMMQIPVSLLGGGSNMLVSSNGYKGLIIRPQFLDIAYEDINAETVRVTVGAGVALDAFVEEVVSRGLWGVENLSGVPGTVGATPVQNVGAYGTEVSDVIESVHVYDMHEEKFSILNCDACAFSYRDSIFKNESGKKFCITHVTFLLSKKINPKISYKDLAHYFSVDASPSLADIRSAVLTIRSNKFPDWNSIGTAGSFFKNPFVTQAEFKRLVSEYPDIPAYNTDSDSVKISLGYILDKVCGLKGFKEGRVGLFEKQALVLVCDKGIDAEEIEKFSEKIIALVFEKTKIVVEREVTNLK